MITWSFLIDFNDGGGDQDITAYVMIDTIKRRRQLWKNLRPVVDSLTFKMQRNPTTITKLLTTDGRIDITVMRDSSPFFKGLIRSNLKVSVRNTVQPVSIECVDYGELLNRKIKNTFQWVNYKVCDVSTGGAGGAIPERSLPTRSWPDLAIPVAAGEGTNSSLVHQLLVLAGFELTDIEIDENIDKTIDYFVNCPVHQERTYAEVLTEILFEFGYVYYWGTDGTFRIYNFLPTDTTTTEVQDNDSMLDELTITKKLMDYEGAEVRFYAHKTEEDALVFNDTTGGDSDYPCNIEVAASGYYPNGCGDRNVYSEYQFEGGEIVVVKDAAMSVTKDAEITYDTAFVNYYKRGLFGFVNGAGSAKKITKLQIIGDVVYRSDLGKSRCNLIADTEKLFVCDAEFLTTMADADKLSIGLARYFKYSDFTYTVQSKTVYSLGDFVDIEDEMLGIDNRCVVVGIEDVNAELGLFRYTLEGISEYTAETVAQEGTFTPAPPPIPGAGPTIVDATVPSYAELIEGFTSGGGTKTPTVPTIAVCKPVGTHSILLQWDRQLDLTNFARYEVQVSPDNSTWYSLKFDGTDYKDTLDADTDWASEMLVHAGIPHTGDADDPVGQLLYYRVRRVTKEPIQSAWSTADSATTNVVASGDLAADSIYANNLIASEINTMLLRASAAVIVGYAGTGTNSSPDEGDRRAYIDDDEIGLEVYANGAWSTERQIKLGGLDTAGNFAPFLSCRGIFGDMADAPTLDPIPASGFYLFRFEDNLEDQDGVDPWTAIAGSAAYSSDPVWEGTKALKASSSTNLVLRWLSGWNCGDSATICGMVRLADSSAYSWFWFYYDADNYVKVEVAENVIAISCKKGGTETVSNNYPTLAVNTWYYYGLIYDSSTNKIYFRLGTIEYSATPGGAWGSSSAGYIEVYLTGTDHPAYLDDALVAPASAISPALFFQHAVRLEPWDPDYSAEDIFLQPRSGGVIRALGDLAVSGDIFAPSGKVYDTGWINRSDWTNVHLGSTTTKDTDSNVVHSLNAPLSDLLVKVFISTDGTDANSMEVLTFSRDSDTSTPQYTGYGVYQVDANTIKVQTGSRGVAVVADNGKESIIDSEDYYYKVKVWNLG